MHIHMHIHMHMHMHAINGLGRVNDFGKARATFRAGSDGLRSIFQISMLGNIETWAISINPSAGATPDS
jgi:hypothetical protein